MISGKKKSVAKSSAGTSGHNRTDQRDESEDPLDLENLLEEM